MTDFQTDLDAIKERVQRGMDLLNRASPGWRERIDLEQLDLSSCSRCIIGQINGSVSLASHVGRFNLGLKGLGFSELTPEQIKDVSQPHYSMLDGLETWQYGFDSPPESLRVMSATNYFGSLTDEWKRRILGVTR